MTTPRSSSDALHPYFNPAFFRGLLRRNWPKLLCCSLLFFFILPLPLIFTVNDYDNLDAFNIGMRLDRALTNSLWLYAVATAAIAVFLGMLATRYLTRRAAVDYYHALPIRREGLLLAHWLEGVVHFVSALLFNLLLTAVYFLTVAEAGAGYERVFGKLLAVGGLLLPVFLLFYTLTVFCGMLCGTSLMQLIVTGLTLGAYPLARLLFLAFADEAVHYIDLYTMVEPSWCYLSPLLRLFYLSGTDRCYEQFGATERTLYVWENPFLWWELVLWVAFAALLIAGAVWVYRHRHVERAGTPVVFGGVASAVRWVTVLLGTLGLGWIFENLGNSPFWLLFGFLLGAFLSFILVGSLLTKNPKQMFEGWRRLIVFMVAFCLLFVGLMWGISALSRRIPKNIDGITLYFEGDNYSVREYRDPAVIAAWCDLRESAATEYGYNEYGLAVPIYEEAGEDYFNNSGDYQFGEHHLVLTAYLRIRGMVIPYEPVSYLRSDLSELYRAIADSEEFQAGWELMIDEIARQGVRTFDPLTDEPVNMFEQVIPVDQGEVKMTYYFAKAYAAEAEIFYKDLLQSYYNADDALAPVGEGTLAAILADCREVSAETFQHPMYASMLLYNTTRADDYRSTNRMLRMGIYMSDPSLYREAMGMEEDAFYEALADAVLMADPEGILVAKRVHYSFSEGDPHVMRVNDREQVIEILRGLSVLDPSDNDLYGLCDLTVYDEGYGVIFPNSEITDVTWFIDGKVPAFVKEALG